MKIFEIIFLFEVIIIILKIIYQLIISSIVFLIDRLFDYKINDRIYFYIFIIKVIIEVIELINFIKFLNTKNNIKSVNLYYLILLNIGISFTNILQNILPLFLMIISIGFLMCNEIEKYIYKKYI